MNQTEPLDSKRCTSGRRISGWCGGSSHCLKVCATLLLAVGLWLGTDHLVRGMAAARLPALPDLRGQPLAMVKQLRTADREARRDPGAAAAVGRLGIFYHANLFYEQAMHCYELAQRLDTQSWKWSYGLALLQTEMGPLTLVVPAWQRVVKRNPDLISAWYWLGEARFKQNNYEEAEKAYRHASIIQQDGGKGVSVASPSPSSVVGRRSPIGAYATLGLARIAMYREQTYPARRILVVGVSHWPRFRPLHRMLGQLYEQLGEPQQAKHHFQLAEKCDPYVPPPDPLIEDLTRQSSSSVFLLRQATLANNGNDLQRAVALIRQAIRVNPADLGGHRQLGELLQELDHSETALPYLHRWLEGHPDDADTLQLLGSCYMALARPDEAMTSFAKAVELAPDNANGHMKIADAFKSQQKTDEAMFHYKRALKIDPHYVSAHNHLGLILVEQERIDEAIDHFRQALQIDADSFEAHNNLANTLRLTGHMDEALTHYREAMRSTPDSLPTLVNLAATLEGQGHIEKAIEHYEEAVRRGVDEALVPYRVARLLLQIGRAREAIPHFHAAIQQEPEWPDPLAALAWIRATHPDPNLRDPAEAIQCARRAAQLTRNQDRFVLDILAAALASAGRFEEAVTIIDALLHREDAATIPGFVNQLRSRLNLYRQGQPYRQSLQHKGYGVER